MCGYLYRPLTEFALIMHHCLSRHLGNNLRRYLFPGRPVQVPYRSLRVISVYLLTTNCPPYGSIPPEDVFPLLYPHLITGDFNLHYLMADPLRSLSHREYTLSAQYLDTAFDAPYHLLNTLGVYTRFLFDTISRLSVLDLTLANSSLSPFVSSWDTPIPSTGSDHVPIVITLQPPAIMPPPPTPHWALLDWSLVKGAMIDFSFPLCLARVSVNALARWFDISSIQLTTLMTSHAPSRHLCPHSKLW